MEQVFGRLGIYTSCHERFGYPIMVPYTVRAFLTIHSHLPCSMNLPLLSTLLLPTSHLNTQLHARNSQTKSCSTVRLVKIFTASPHECRSRPDVLRSMTLTPVIDKITRPSVRICRLHCSSRHRASRCIPRRAYSLRHRCIFCNIGVTVSCVCILTVCIGEGGRKASGKYRQIL